MTLEQFKSLPAEQRSQVEKRCRRAMKKLFKGHNIIPHAKFDDARLNWLDKQPLPKNKS